jgi:AmpE protein
MKLFLIILIGLGLDKWFESGNALRRWQWFDAYVSGFLTGAARINMSLEWPAFVLFLALPLVILAFVCWLLSLWLFGFLSFLFGLGVFWYCLELPALNNTVILESEHVTEVSVSTQELVSDTASGFWQTHERIFAIIFWFILLGPVGAVLYRLVWLCEAESSLFATHVPSIWRDYALRVHGVLAWVPARLLGLTYVLAGDFVPTFKTWCDYAFRLGYSRELVTQCGTVGLRTAPESGAIRDMGMRALIIWLAVITVFTLGYIWY